MKTAIPVLTAFIISLTGCVFENNNTSPLSELKTETSEQSEYAEEVAEINNRISEFDPNNFLTYETLTAALDEFTEITDDILALDSETYPEIDFTSLSSKFDIFKMQINTIKTGIDTSYTNIDSLKVQLESLQDMFSNYEMVTSHCDTMISICNQISDDYTDTSAFISAVGDMKTFTQSNSFSNENSDIFLEKYSAIAEAYNNMVEDFNIYFQNGNIDHISSQAEKVAANIDLLNNAIAEYNNSGE